MSSREFYKLSPTLRAPSLGFERGFFECKNKLTILGVFEQLKFHFLKKPCHSFGFLPSLDIERRVGDERREMVIISRGSACPHRVHGLREWRGRNPRRRDESRPLQGRF
jgi:hypothetical protein